VLGLIGRITVCSAYSKETATVKARTRLTKEIEWKFDYSSCVLGVQHVWWTVHVVNVIAAIWAAVLALWYTIDFLLPAKKTVPAEKTVPVEQTAPAKKIAVAKKRKKTVSAEKKKQ
jgi:phosphotransferase system  glucose/maltose/N-acetylglucosamine-specific IIC component